MLLCGAVLLAVLSGVAEAAQPVATTAAQATTHSATQTVTTVKSDGTRREETRLIKVTSKQSPKAALASATTKLRSGEPPTRQAVRGLRPNFLPGYAGVSTSAQNFGSVAVGGTPVTMTLTFPIPSGVMELNGNLAIGLDFSASNSVCTSTQCSATFTFTPRFPGLSKDALITTDQNDNVVYETFLYGTGTAPQLGFDLGNLMTIDAYSNQPDSVAVGPDGSIYVADASQGTVSMSTPGFGTTTQVPFGTLGGLGGIAVDGNNTVFVVNKSNNQIVAYNNVLESQANVPLTSPLSNPNGIAVDGAGNLYIADTGNRRIEKIDNQGVQTDLATGIDSPTSIAVDAAGNVFYIDGGSGGEISKLPAGGGAANTLAIGFGTMYDIAVDAADRIYISTPAGVILLTANGSVTYSGTSNYGMALDLAGDIITTQPGSSSVSVTTRAGSAVLITTAVGTTLTANDTISNTGNSPLTISNVAIDGTVFTQDPSTQCMNAAVLQPGSTCRLTVDFTPTAVQSYQQTYTATSNTLNVANSTDEDTLDGVGTGPGTGSGGTVPTTTTLSVSPNPVAAGQPVGLTATVQRTGTGTPSPLTATVAFFDGATRIGTVSLANGASYAQVFPSNLAVGTHSITASYTGDTVNETSTSPAQTLVVTGVSVATTTTLLSGQQSRLGQSIYFQVQVAPNPSQTPVPTGTVTLTNTSVSPAAVLGTLTIDSTGTAFIYYAKLPLGNNSIVATYSGDATYASSISAPDAVTVLADQTTITTLTATPATIAYRTPITLTATVAAGDSNLGGGQVYFCDASLPVACNRTSNIGVAQISSSAASATLKLAPGTIGLHNFTATLVPVGGFAASVSTPQAVTITGELPSTTTIATTGTAGNYSVTGTVVSTGSNTVGPTGMVAFLDTSNANTSLGTAALGSPTLGFTAATAAGGPNTTARGSYGQVAGDFNGDGFLDLAVENYLDNTVSILLGKGDGTFQPGVKYNVGTEPERILTADLDGDGNLDLIVANTASNTISVLLGVGDGTFAAQVTYPCDSPVGLGIRDINNDGVPDVVAGDYYSNTISVLIGAGDGTFQPAVTYATGRTPQTVAEEDFNGDGFTDVVVGNLNDNTVGIFLNNGDGTFQPMVTYAVGAGPQGVQAGDFNGDGKADLAVTNHEDGTISVLLGNGDGTFQAQVTYPVGGQPVGIVIADFNGDGKQDISIGNTAQSSLTEGILLGNGDGTFQPQLTFPTGNFPYGESVGDFNGDGYPDIGISNFSDGTATVLLSQVTETATGTQNITIGGSPTSTHAVEASYAGDPNVSASVSATTDLTGGGTVAGAASSTTLTIISPSTPTAGQSVTFSVAVVGTEQVTPTPSGTVTLMNTTATPATVLGTITLNASGIGSFSTSTLAAGTYKVAASYSGDAAYQASVSTAQTFTIATATAPVLTGLSPAGAIAGAAATTVTLTGSAFTSTDQVDVGKTVLTTTLVNATTLTVVIPANLLTAAATLPVTVTDTASGNSSTVASFLVEVAPVVVFTGPSTAASGDQPVVTFQLRQPYATPINCVLTLTFVPATSTGIDDPAVQFSSGGRTINVTVPAGSVTTPDVQFQAGTVAGTVTVSLAITADDVNVTPTSVAPVVVVLPEVVPQLATAKLVRPTASSATNALTVNVTGFSNTREIKSAIFHFTPAQGNTLSNPDVTIDATTIFAAWFSNPSSDAYGSTFTYSQPFNLSADPATIQSVTITLVNAAGDSTVTPAVE